jgi:hypothetical protein
MTLPDRGDHAPHDRGDVEAAIPELAARQSGVLTAASAIACLGESAVRWRLTTGRWQRPCRGVVVTHSGPLADEQILWAAVLAAGPGAVLAGLTAARLDGLTGFGDRRIHVLVPEERRVRSAGLGMTVHRSTLLRPDDVHPVRLPPRTRLARSVVDAAAWAGTDNRARAVLAAGVQQRLVRVSDLWPAVEHRPNLHRHALIRATLADISGGAEALSELDFCRLTRRYRLPEPDRQVIRCDQEGRRRWLDAIWRQARLVAEVDGLWHMDPATWWADMSRDNELTISGHRVLRFPAFAVRDHPELVAGQIAAVLGLEFGMAARRAVPRASCVPGDRAIGQLSAR